MPAETHQHRDPVDLETVLELLWAVTAAPGEPDPDVPLTVVGLAGDLPMLDVWDAVSEEYGERTLGVPELDELRELRTVGELATLVQHWVGVDSDEAAP
jgi:hypothetical protein